MNWVGVAQPAIDPGASEGVLRTFDGDGTVHETRLAVFVVLAAGAHFLGGRFGWLDRYEVYVMATVVAALIYVWRGPLARALARPSPRPFLAGLALIVVAGWPYLRATAITPIAAREIYQQQYQMHRFAAQVLRAPVAVNDLGLVAYRNPHYVLDLWGLGLEEMRRARRHQATRAQVLEALTRSRGIAAAMIYENWFQDVLPTDWRPVARLSLGHEPWAIDTATVTFFATAPEQARALRRQLKRFARTLPPGVRLELVDG